MIICNSNTQHMTDVYLRRHDSLEFARSFVQTSLQCTNFTTKTKFQKKKKKNGQKNDLRIFVCVIFESKILYNQSTVFCFVFFFFLGGGV